jgi:hypothetical protein
MIVGLLAITAAPSTAASQRASKDRGAAAVLGTWRLVSFDVNDASLREMIGPHPSGLLMYSGDGYMMVQILPTLDRPAQPVAFGAFTPSQALDLLRGYNAYYGTYTVDPSAHTVTHHQLGSMGPNGRATADLVRSFHFQGSQLVLTTLQQPSVRLTWERVK